MVSQLKRTKVIYLLLLVVFGLCMPQNLHMPVVGASQNSYHSKSFWHSPWGKSGTHKGVDIFANEGTPIYSSTYGLVVYTDSVAMGGNVVVILGPKWRLHYYAHLKKVNTRMLAWVHPQKSMGTVGTTGNAKGKPAHLHYSIVTLLLGRWMEHLKAGKKCFTLTLYLTYRSVSFKIRLLCSNGYIRIIISKFMKAFFRDIFKYHHHFNQKISIDVKKHLLAMPNKTLPTLCHMINSHQIWNARILGQNTIESSQIHDIDALPHLDLQNLSNTLKIIDHEDFDRLITYTDTGGVFYTTKVRDVLFHVNNYHTHHRAQILGDFRSLGIVTIDSDYIAYKASH